MKHSKTLFSLFIISVCLSGVSASANNGKGATRVENAIWAHDVIYDTVATPTAFKNHPIHSLDLIYSFAMNLGPVETPLSGQRSVSEVAPGDKGFNGGRWWVQMVEFTESGVDIVDADHDGVIDTEITNAEDILLMEEAGYLTITPSDIYFVCPMLNSKN